MTRYLYPGETGVQAGVLQDLDAYLAPDSAFAVWTDDQAGVNVSTLMRARDGTTVIPLVSDSTGNYPALRGPDDVNARVLWRDTGASIRYPMYPVDAIAANLNATSLDPVLARLDALEAGTGGGTADLAGYAVLIRGATSLRINPATGLALPAGTAVIWVAERRPDRIIDGDV